MKHIVLDSGPLGTLSNPNATAEVISLGRWSYDCIAAGHKLYIPEVIDYELRRELIRARKPNGITKLDGLKATFEYLPITSLAMSRAADLWAFFRQTGIPTSAPDHLDIDVILSAQALTLPEPLADIVVATSNVRHISRFVAAEVWSKISP